MILTPNFELEEFERSQQASRLGIDNRVPSELLGYVRQTAEMLQRIRDHLSSVSGQEIPITVTSGYRRLELNRAIGSSDSSDHVKGMAVDWIAPKFGNPISICRTLAPLVDVLRIGQLINEYPDRDGWVHTSIRTPTKIVNRVITITHAGTSAGVQSPVA